MRGWMLGEPGENDAANSGDKPEASNVSFITRSRSRLTSSNVRRRAMTLAPLHITSLEVSLEPAE